MYKPLGNRVIVRINKKYLYEGKKPILDERGQHAFTEETEGVVLASNVEGLKKGDIVVPIIRGGVPILSQESKKFEILSFDFDDLYAQKV